MECEHAICTCQVEGDNQYCSEHCRQEHDDIDLVDTPCQCGHSECAGMGRENEDDGEPVVLPPH